MSSIQSSAGAKVATLSEGSDESFGGLGPVET
jgi:hypothetical protein